MYPTAQQYIDILTKDGSKEALASKWGVELVYDSLGNPIYHIGSHSIVFKFRGLKSNKFRAYKFFTRNQHEIVERYKETELFRRENYSAYIPRIIVREDALTMKTSDGKVGKFPMIVMDWVEGTKLSEYIRKKKYSPCELGDIFCKFMKMASWLITSNINHGDLHPGNIMVDSTSNLVLVDFDNFRTPSSKRHYGNHEEGKEYFHPQAHYIGHSSYYNDDFSISLLALSLRAIVIDLSLLTEYEGIGGILLSYDDLKDISKSNKLKEVFPSLDPVLDELYGLFLRCYNEFILPKSEFLNVANKCEVPVHLNPTPTRREKKYSFKDEFGATYSSNGLKLIEFDGFSYGYDQKIFKPRPECITICDNAFRYSLDDCKIIIPESVLSIGVNALPKCAIENHSSHFLAQNGTLFSKDKTRLLNIFSYESSLYEVPMETRMIGDGAIPSEAAPYFVKIQNMDIHLDPSDSVIIVETEDQKQQLIEKGVREDRIFIGNVFLDSHDVLYTDDNKTLLCFPRESHLRSYEILENCENIADNAFPNIPSPDDDGWMDYIGNDLLMITFPKKLKSIADYALLGMTDLKVARYNKADEENVFMLLDTYHDAFMRSFRERVTMIPDKHYTERYESNFEDYEEDSRFVQYSSDNTKLIGNIIGERGTYRVHESCKIICDAAFENSAFDKIVLSDSIEAIGAYAFENSEVKEIIINAGVKAIEDNAFKGCKNLKYIAFPSGLYYTGDGLFLGCESLRYIVIPASLLRLDFDGIPKTISKIYIEEGSIFFKDLYEDERFSHKLRPITSTTALPYEFDNAIQEDSILYSTDRKRLLSINGDVEVLDIPEGTEIICDEAFNDLTNARNEGRLRELILPSTLKEIGRNVFCGSINIIESNSPMFICKDDMLLSEDGHILYYYYGNCDGEFNFDNEINHIWSGAFISRKIKSVNNGSSIYKIDDNPFLDVFPDEIGGNGIMFKGDYYGNYRAGYDCLYSPRYWGKEPVLIGYYGSSTDVDLRGMDLGQILKYAFFGSLLEKVYLPSSIKFIHPEAFEWCFELKQIIVEEGQKDRFKLMLPEKLGKYVVEEKYPPATNFEPDNDLPF